VETLFTVSLMELFVGGGGRLLEVGPLTVRMILFAICLIVGTLVAVYRPHKDDGVVLAICLVGAYLLVHLSALMIGAARGHDLDFARAEMQQSLYWLAAPFLAVVLRTQEMVVRAAAVVRVAGVVLALGYIAFVAALALGAIDFITLNAILSDSGEFAFRTESFFFYKGFLYLGIAAIFFIALPKRGSTVWLALVVAALAMTLTRGFVLSTSFAALAMLVAQRRWRPLSVAMVAVGCAAFFVWGYLPSQEETLDASRDESNNQRIADFAFVMRNLKVSTLLMGEGLGALINGRLNIENTFLWAIWRLGIAGFLFWLTPFVMCLNYFSRIGRHHPHFPLACAYFFSTLLVYLQTMANPYLNNPIGLSFVLVAVFSLRSLAQPVRHCAAMPHPASHPRTTPERPSVGFAR
jgi:hypothetical protein